MGKKIHLTENEFKGVVKQCITRCLNELYIQDANPDSEFEWGGKSDYEGSGWRHKKKKNASEKAAFIENSETIPSMFFRGKRMKTFNVPEHIKRIEKQAFAFCNELLTINLPSSLELIGIEAFENCQQLKTIELPGSVRGIAKKAFINCSSLTKLFLPVNINFIGNKAFYGCSNLKYVELPLKFKAIVEDIFDTPGIEFNFINTSSNEHEMIGDKKSGFRFASADGSSVSNAKFNSISQFDENGLAVVSKKTSQGPKYNFIKRNGELLHPAFWFKSVTPFENGVSLVKANKQRYTLNLNGELLNQ